MYRTYIIIQGTAHFSKKMPLDKCIEYLNVVAANNWIAGMIDASVSLEEAQTIFKEVVEPKNGWEAE